MSDLILVGGPNGSGKSTFIREFLEDSRFRYLCADEVAFELNRENPEAVAARAGRIFLQRIREACDNGDDVVVESTLAGKSFRKIVERYRDAGYRVRMVFVTPLDVEENVKRVAQRVEKGGHHVPETHIRRRFQRAHANFWELYRQLATTGWDVFANKSGYEKSHICRGWEKGIEVLNQGDFEKFLKICYSVE